MSMPNPIGLLSIFLALVIVCATEKSKLPHEPTDSYRMIGSLPYIAAVYTSSADPTFKCLSAKRTRFDIQHRLATYVWSLQGHEGTQKKQSTFDITPGNGIDTVTFFLDQDLSHPYTAYYKYSDYKNCVVATIPYKDEELCMLWIRPSMADAVPEDCQAHFEDECEVRFPQYDKNICKYDEE